jgi:hypothetical protein
VARSAASRTSFAQRAEARIQMRHLKRAVTLFAGIGEQGAMEPEV